MGKSNNKEEVSNKELNKVLLMTMVINIILLLLKLTAGILSNSKGLLADGIHSGSDVVTTFGVLIALVLAKKPRDQKHPYGHEKIETVVTFLLAIILVLVGLNIGINSFFALKNQQMVVVGKYAFFAASISIVLKEFQYQVTIKIANKINSEALRADAWHHRSDAFSSIAALVGILGAYFGFMMLDSIMGLVVSLIVVKVGLDILNESFHGLIDVSIQIEDIDEIKEKIMALEEIHFINDIRTRRHGSVVFVDVKVCVDPYMEVHEGHRVADEIEGIIRAKIQHLEDVIVHLDPCLLDIKKNKKHCSNKQCNML